MAGRRIEVFWLESGESVVSSRVPGVPQAPLVFGFDGRVWGALARSLVVFDPARPEDLKLMGSRVFDPEISDYDRWYVEWCRDVLGVDILASGGFAAPPEPLFGWAAG